MINWNGCPRSAGMRAHHPLEHARKHAIANRIAPEIARNAVNAMLIGTGRLVEAQGRCPSDIVGDFLAYQGMTTAGLESMMDAGIDRIVSEGVEAALKKAQEL